LEQSYPVLCTSNKSVILACSGNPDLVHTQAGSVHNPRGGCPLNYMFVVSRDTLASFAVPDAEGEFGHLFVDLPAFLHESGNLLHGMDHGGVVSATELTGDRGVGKVR
jgi:hypothetical protein